MKKTLIAGVASILAMPLLASELNFDAIGAELRNRATELQNEQTAQQFLDDLGFDVPLVHDQKSVQSEMLDLAEQLAKESQRSMRQYAEDSDLNIGFEDIEKQFTTAGSSENEYLIFISSSMGTSAMDEVLESLSGRDDAVAIIRGLFPGDRSLNDTIRTIGRLVTKYDPVPNLILDPTLFQDYGVENVPVMIARRNEEEIARVSGLTGLEWFERQLSFGDTGNFGRKGPVELVAERDLTEEIEERASQLDMAQKQTDARERVWQRYGFTDLPVAKYSQQRVVDPTVIVPQDITDHEGNIIAPAGYMFNPMDTMPFNRRVVVFDATDPRQVEIVANLPAAGQVVTTYVSTRLDRDDGWQSLRDIQDLLDAPVYLLNGEFVRAFQLQVIPSVVTGDNDAKRYLIKEIAPENRGES